MANTSTQPAQNGDGTDDGKGGKGDGQNDGWWGSPSSHVANESTQPARVASPALAATIAGGIKARADIVIVQKMIFVLQHLLYFLLSHQTLLVLV